LESELLGRAAKSPQNVEQFSKSVQTVGVPLPWLAREYRRTPLAEVGEVDNEPFLTRRQMEASKLWSRLTTRTCINLKVSVGTVRVEHKVKQMDEVVRQD
jgi:hypothetical protein